MAVIEPFAALRPRPEVAARLCELPYDVMSAAEARALAENNPLSFLHVSKSEIDVPPGTPADAPAVYLKAKENFQRLQASGALNQDPTPAFYLYRQVMGRHCQTGLVAVASCEDYLQNVVRKHELTRPDKEDDRVRHIEAVNAQTGPAFLVYRAVRALDDFLKTRTEGPPAVDFFAADSVHHSAWTIQDSAAIEFIANEFRHIPRLYIADGHHRSAAAARVCQARQGAGGSGFFLAVIFSHAQVRILPYHRVLKDLNGLTAEQLLKKLEPIVSITTTEQAAPDRQHELGLYLAGRWHRLRFHSSLTAEPDPFEQLDVTLLQRHVLGPLFGISDPRTSNRLGFVGGIRGTAELEKLVNSGEFAGAFALYPTGIEELMTIADADGLMPPKSTWFEPKLRDGMFCHLLGP